MSCETKPEASTGDKVRSLNTQEYPALKIGRALVIEGYNLHDPMLMRLGLLVGITSLSISRQIDQQISKKKQK